MSDYMDFFYDSLFAFDGKNNIIGENHLGICGPISSVLTPAYSPFALKSLQACPYSATSLSFDIRIDGERIKCLGWKWLPSAIYRFGEIGNISVKTLSCVLRDGRGVVQKVSLVNESDLPRKLSFQVEYRGKTAKKDLWTFDIPDPEYSKVEEYFDNGRIIGASDGECTLAISSSLDSLKMFKLAYLWETEIILQPKATTNVYFSAHIGPHKDTLIEVENISSDYERAIECSFDYLRNEQSRIHSSLPRFKSDNNDLTALYYRSLVTYIMCRWDNPDLCVMPYFSTGGVNGGCMCSYLWDYCGGLMLHPLYDAEANKRQIKALLKNDLTKSYALNPVTAGPVGPWYMVNQEKIILMVYYHVLHTGEREFLLEKVNEKTIIEHMIEQAYICDDISREVELYDYGVGRFETKKFKSGGEFSTWFGEGNAHLELRRGYTYNGIIPDLNARRYLNYMRVYELTCLCGQPDDLLPKRAASLKEKLRLLWNDEAGWYDYISSGKRDTRYTVQMFKFLNSAVIEDKERKALISHLNEREFLSRFGLHSMSKLDPAYDQDDIDNGGGGICTHFTMQICYQLYSIGEDALATDILKRVLWWGTRLPYLGDSCAANVIANREDTPLQGDISSVSAAQMIIFAIFGITVDFDGKITVSPAKIRPAETLSLENVKLQGKTFSIYIDNDKFTVSHNGMIFTANIGENIDI